MKQLQRTLVSETKTNYTWWYEIITVKKCEYEWFTFVYTQTYRKENETEDEFPYAERTSELCVQWTDCSEVIAEDVSLIDDEVRRYAELNKWNLCFHTATTDDVCKKLFQRSIIDDYAKFRSKCRAYSFFQLWWLYRFGMAHKDLWLYELDPQDEVDVPKMES